MLPRNDLRERFELERKVKVLRQSMRKVENACYNINVRGTEVPKHMLKGCTGTVKLGRFLPLCGLRLTFGACQCPRVDVI